MSESTQIKMYHRLRQYTEARIGLSTTGSSLGTEDLLKFQADWAQARDAVYYAVDFNALADKFADAGLSSVCVTSSAPSRAVYLRRPDLGRALSDDGRRKLLGLKETSPDIAVVVVDGLSGLAVSEHSPSLVRAFSELAASQNWRLSPIILAEQGRVAIGDPIGHAVSARLTVVIIGERPGLSAADSLGVYITYNPSNTRTDAERNCISNIRPGGQDPEAAAATMVYLIREALKLQVSGVQLKDNSNLAIESSGA